MSLRGAEGDEAIPDNVTPHPSLSGGLLSTLSLLRGTKGGGIQLASLTRKDKNWTAYQVRNDRLPSFVIPAQAGIQNPIHLTVLKKE